MMNKLAKCKGTTFVLMALMVLGTLVGHAEAAITVHTDLDSWRSSLGSYITETFNGQSLSSGVSVMSSNGQIASLMWTDRIVPGSATTTWGFSKPMNAWGADLWDLSPDGMGTGIRVYLDGVSVPAEIPNTQIPLSGFWGVTSSTPFSQVLLMAGSHVGNSETYIMDNMSYSVADLDPTPVQIPAPGALVLCSLGAVLSGYFRRTRSQRDRLLGKDIINENL